MFSINGIFNTSNKILIIGVVIAYFLTDLSYNPEEYFDNLEYMIAQLQRNEWLRNVILILMFSIYICEYLTYLVLFGRPSTFKENVKRFTKGSIIFPLLATFSLLVLSLNFAHLFEGDEVIILYEMLFFCLATLILFFIELILETSFALRDLFIGQDVAQYYN